MVTAQARAIMINACAAVRNSGLDVRRHIIYMDTDSYVVTPEAFASLEKE